MKKELPWYARESGRWHASIEAALASNNSYRRCLAWAILATVGGGHRYQTRFAKLTGVGRSVISFYLSGRSRVSPKAAREINSALEKHLNTKLINLDYYDHPFEIGAGGTWAVPGDGSWEDWWTAFKVVAPGNPSAEELKKRFPELFP